MWGPLYLTKLWLAPCCEFCILSFGWFPSVPISCANVLEHSVCSIYEDGTDRVFRKVGTGNSDARELPKRKNTIILWLLVYLLFSITFFAYAIFFFWSISGKVLCSCDGYIVTQHSIKWSNSSNSNYLLLQKSARLCWFWREKCLYSERMFLYLWTVASQSAEPAWSAKGTSRNCGNLILFYSVGNVTIVPLLVPTWYTILT